MKTKNLVMILSLCFVFSLTLVSAIEIERGIQNQDKLLYQTCNNCSFCNFTKIIGPSNDTILSNIEPTQDGTYYSFVLGGGNTTRLGWYSYFYYCGNAVDSQTGKIDFEITPSGRGGNDNIAFYIIVIVMIYAVTLLSFFGRNIQLSILTGMMMTFFGVYIINNGIIIYRDTLTNYFGYVTIAIGATIAIMSAIAWIDGED